MMFPRRIGESIDCPTCGPASRHEKEGTTHEMQFLMTFFTLGLWAPVWIVCTVMERRRPFRCVTDSQTRIEEFETPIAT